MKHQIMAHHLGFGLVGFIIEADDDKKAFSKWKQVVFNPRQWIIKSNTPLTAGCEPDVEESTDIAPLVHGQRLQDVEEL